MENLEAKVHKDCMTYPGLCSEGASPVPNSPLTIRIIAQQPVHFDPLDEDRPLSIAKLMIRE